MPATLTALPTALIEGCRVVSVRGRDARSFLQGQLTQDLALLGPEAFLPGALLTPQGRVIAAPWLRDTGDALGLVLPANLADAVLSRLQRYVLRSKVQLDRAPLDVDGALALARQIDPDDEHTDLLLACVRAGQPLIDAGTTEEWIPQMLNLDLLAGISFTKGCYTGQEIVARTQHLGRIKRRMFRYRATGAAPQPKAALHLDAQKVGEVVFGATAGADCEFLAVVHLEARDLALALEGGAPCTPLPLPYAVP